MKLSVIIPSYNAANFIESAYQQILDQGINDFEIIYVEFELFLVWGLEFNNDVSILNGGINNCFNAFINRDWFTCNSWTLFTCSHFFTIVCKFVQSSIDCCIQSEEWSWNHDLIQTHKMLFILLGNKIKAKNNCYWRILWHIK
mgnify:CR=1 FL=1